MEELSEKQKKEYEKYVKKVTPTTNVWLNMARAFVVGGFICVIGEAITDVMKAFGLNKDDASLATLLILILASVLLTGWNLYPKIVKWGGAGALVPITGFANGVAASANEFKKEGQVMGIGCKIFTIAGPVILYGVFTSWVLGLVYWLAMQIM